MRGITLGILGSMTALASVAACSGEGSVEAEPGSGGSIIQIGSGGVPTTGGSGGTSAAGGGGAGATGGSGGAARTGSCQGSCGQISTDGCYCDAECEVHSDCCPDFGSECKSRVKTLPAGCVSDPYFFVLCNPVDNDGCDTSAGEACDWMTGGLKCWPDGNTEPAGATCDTKAGKYCVPTYTCDGASTSNPIGTCKKYCCSSADCGGASCKAFDSYLGTLGVCESPAAGGDAAGG